MLLTKSIKFILKKISIRVFYSTIAFCLICFFINSQYLTSILWGTFFSFCIFSTFVYSQHFILLKANKGNFLILFFLRLLLYIIALSMGLVIEKYFNFFIILIFLFHYQIHYIGFEFFRSYKKYKRNYK